MTCLMIISSLTRSTRHSRSNQGLTRQAVEQAIEGHALAVFSRPCSLAVFSQYGGDELIGTYERK
jgi:hypothetical protein